MEIRVYANYEFCDITDTCPENGKLYMSYTVPKSWSKWSDEKKEKWIQKNQHKIQKEFENCMCICFSGTFEER